MMYKKLGIIEPIEEDKTLIRNLLTLMESYKADYTNTFAALTLNKIYKDSLFSSNEFSTWKKQWEERIKNDKSSYKIMGMNNPMYIPRNHLVESSLKNAISGNNKDIDELLSLMSNTYNYSTKNCGFQATPEGFDESYQTFCGT